MVPMSLSMLNKAIHGVSVNSICRNAKASDRTHLCDTTTYHLHLRPLARLYVDNLERGLSFLLQSTKMGSCSTTRQLGLAPQSNSELHIANISVVLCTPTCARSLPRSLSASEAFPVSDPPEYNGRCQQQDDVKNKSHQHRRLSQRITVENARTHA